MKTIPMQPRHETLRAILSMQGEALHLHRAIQIAEAERLEWSIEHKVRRQGPYQAKLTGKHYGNQWPERWGDSPSAALIAALDVYFSDSG